MNIIETLSQFERALVKKLGHQKRILKQIRSIIKGLKVNGERKSKPKEKKPGRRKLRPAERARISIAMKKRWAQKGVDK